MYDLYFKKFAYKNDKQEERTGYNIYLKVGNTLINIKPTFDSDYKKLKDLALSLGKEIK